MQKLEVKYIIEKIEETKFEVKRELEDSIVNHKRNENVEMQQKVYGCITSKDTVKPI